MRRVAAESIEATRAVRLAAHELANICAAITGGVEMSLSLPSVDMLGQPVRGLASKPKNG